MTLTADPVEEVYAARDILKAIGLRREGPDLIACPTCGRTKIDLIPLAQAVEERLKTVTKPITVAVMGCPVNGPGEAAAADVGIAGGNGKGLLFAGQGGQAGPPGGPGGGADGPGLRRCNCRYRQAVPVGPSQGEPCGVGAEARPPLGTYPTGLCL